MHQRIGPRGKLIPFGEGFNRAPELTGKEEGISAGISSQMLNNSHVYLFVQSGLRFGVIRLSLNRCYHCFKKKNENELNFGDL